jgi:hypothetical protein
MAQNPEKIQTFQVGMSGIDVAIPIIGYFDFSLLESSSPEDQTVELVDVGGEHRSPLKQILDKHPELDPKKCVLQDRPEMIEMAKAGGLLPEGVAMSGHDFMTE